MNFNRDKLSAIGNRAVDSAKHNKLRSAVVIGALSGAGILGAMAAKDAHDTFAYFEVRSVQDTGEFPVQDATILVGNRVYEDFAGPNVTIDELDRQLQFIEAPVEFTPVTKVETQPEDDFYAAMYEGLGAAALVMTAVDTAAGRRRPPDAV